MSEKTVKELKKMCRAFCQKAEIRWSRQVERQYIKEFFRARRSGLHVPLKRKVSSFLTPEPAIEGTPD